MLAVPPARTAVLDWLGIGGAQIIRVDDLPSVVGDTRSRDPRRPRHARRGAERAGFPFADPPDDERAPDQILLAPGMRVTYVWRADDRARLLVTQFPGDATEPGLVKKLVSSATRIDMLDIDGHRALWLEGGPHAVLFLTPDGNIGTTSAGSPATPCSSRTTASTVRIEAQIDRADAIELARSLVR